ncbi:MAG: MerR family transcriptional regulator [Nitrospinota bacterium]
MSPIDPDKEIYPIGVVAELTGLPQRYLRALEQRGVLKPARSANNRRLYSENDVKKLQQISYLGIFRKVNIAGIKEIFAILDVISPSEKEKVLQFFESQIAKSAETLLTPEEALPAALEDSPGMAEELSTSPQLAVGETSQRPVESPDVEDPPGTELEIAEDRS